MKLAVSLCLLVLVMLVRNDRVYAQNQHGADVDDNEFAEFEDFDEGTDDTLDEMPEDAAVKSEERSKSEKSKSSKEENEFGDEEDEFSDDDATVEVEEDGEFENLDPEEFEGLDGDDTIWENGNQKRKGKKQAKPELKIANVPIHVRSWDKYYIEIMMCCGLVVYLINFFSGRHKNYTIANNWFKTHKELLESQFELVGDDPQNKNAASTFQLTKEAEHIFTLWCSGRLCVEGMLVELRLMKRQDLVSIIAEKMKPLKDQVMISITMEDMDPFVLAVGAKKAIGILQKNMQDLSNFCVDKMRPASKYDLPENMMVTSEMWIEVPNILDAKVRRVINENAEFFEYMHISDQYSGLKPSDVDETPTERPPTSKKLIVMLNMHCAKQTPSIEDITKLVPLMRMTLYMADKIRKLRVSNKAKAEKNRHKIEVAFLKQTHARRQEEAQLKREEKEKAIKERIMNEEDPDKQRKLEDIQNKREARKRDKKLYKSKQMRARVM